MNTYSSHIVSLFAVALMSANGIHGTISDTALREECVTTVRCYSKKLRIPIKIGLCSECPEGSVAVCSRKKSLRGLLKRYIIAIEEDRFLELSRDAREFVLCHELAHIKLKHGFGPDSSPEVSRQKEYEADTLAVQTVGKSRGAVKLFLFDILGLLLNYLLLALIPALTFYTFSKRIRRSFALLCLLTLGFYAADQTIEYRHSSHPIDICRLVHALKTMPY